MSLDTLPIVQSLDILFYIFIFVIGLCLGSFLNSWMWRTRDNTRITRGRSVCIHCRRQLAWYENIPVFSYLFLGGRCLTCHKKIPWHYTLVELFTALALVFVFAFHVDHYANFGLFSEWHILRDVFFLAILVVVFVYDYLYEEVLIRAVILGVIIGLLINLLPLHYAGWNLLLGMLIGSGFFMLQYLVSQGRWIGGGDVWIGLMIGAWLGWAQALLAIFLAYTSGAFIAMFLLFFKKKKMGSTVPFGVFLSVATFFTLYFGNQVIAWYLNFLR